jgi:hypothetical protein
MDLNFEVIGQIYLCHPNGEYITAEEASKPEYSPCIRFTVRRPVKPIRVYGPFGRASQGYHYSPYVPVLKSPVPLGISSRGMGSVNKGTVSGIYPPFSNTFTRTVTAKPRKLKTKWSMEAATDLKGLFSKRRAKKKQWALVYNCGNRRLYDIRRDNQLIRIKIKKRRLQVFLRKILTEKFKIYKMTKGLWEDFSSFTMPVVRQTFPKLINAPLVSVQPMSQSLGLSSFIKTKYGNKIKPIDPKMYSTVKVTNL